MKAPMVIIRSLSLSHFNDRPPATAIDTVVIHSMYVTTGGDKFSVRQCVDRLSEKEVSAHYLIARDGGVYSLVEESKRAWHAGVSKMPFPDDQRGDVNNFSLGIELIGDPEEGYTENQYASLLILLSDLCARYPIRNVVGHDHIAPERKVDPGRTFEWSRVRAAFSSSPSLRVPD